MEIIWIVLLILLYSAKLKVHYYGPNLIKFSNKFTKRLPNCKWLFCYENSTKIFTHINIHPIIISMKSLIYTYIYTHIYLHIHIHIHIFTHPYTHTYIHTCPHGYGMQNHPWHNKVILEQQSPLDNGRAHYSQSLYCNSREYSHIYMFYSV